MNKNALKALLLVLWIVTNDFASVTSDDFQRINRVRGSILRNLTRTHAFDDNIVTSHLDASLRIRQFYRTVRNVYNM